jgi:hypothetical protein
LFARPMPAAQVEQWLADTLINPLPSMLNVGTNGLPLIANQGR